ncbi:MAG TPA: hypothetical protein QGH28_04495 [Chloroflexota bacterium]|nr:hypothetical protein [Chloroflexota bacterium]|tara:strand:- start:237 stop:689 length:453 start_codon:yes stop_codon:yes gene_type:complete
MSVTAAPASTTKEYRGKSRRPGAQFDYRRTALLWAATAAAPGCLLGIAGLLLFANPADVTNVIAFYGLCAFAAFFGIWAAGYWLRMLSAPDREHPEDPWHCTRQALLGTGMVMAAFFLLRTGLFGIPAILVVAATVVGLEFLFTWLGMKE